jgi:hypothetical protein
MDQLYSALVFPLLLLIGQTLVALGQRRLNQRMDEGEAKRNQAKADTAGYLGDGTVKTLSGIVTYDGFHRQ